MLLRQILLFLILGLAGLAAAQQVVEVRPLTRDCMEHLMSEAETPHFRRSSTPGLFEATYMQAERLAAAGHELEFGLDLEQARRRLDRRERVDSHGYDEHETMNDQLRELVRWNAGRASILHLGHSEEGREILGVHVQAQTGRADESRPLVALMGPVHGDEIVGRELLRRFLRDLLEGAPDGDSAYGRLVGGLPALVDLLVVPQLNPDGCAAATRGNGNGVDLNRAFPDRCGPGEDGWTAGTAEREVRATKAFIQAWRPHAILWFHGGAEVVSYAYDRSCTGHGAAASPEDALMRHWSGVYARANPRMSGSRLFPGGVTNGADWYNLAGGAQDWALLRSNRTVYSATVECSGQKLPHASAVEDHYWPANRAAIAHWAAYAAAGAHIRVLDDRGRPLHDARVYAMPADLTNARHDPHPAEHSLESAPGDDGWVHRPLAPGAWDLFVTCPHYVGTIRRAVVEGGSPPLVETVRLRPMH